MFVAIEGRESNNAFVRAGPSVLWLLKALDRRGNKDNSAEAEIYINYWQHAIYLSFVPLRINDSWNHLAERVGFEPTLEFPLNTLSKRAPSTTRPPLQRGLSS
jgi:hypothetical protein